MRVYGDPVLHTAAREATAADGPLDALVEDLFATMYAHSGVGLAAPQIGVPLRVFVYDCPDDEDVRHRGYLINPRLAHTGGMLLREPEGCLSLPGLEAGTVRCDEATAEGSDLEGAPLRVSGTGFFARCLQHELDHLDGTVYPDRVSGLRRRRVLRAARRTEWWGAESWTAVAGAGAAR